MNRILGTLTALLALFPLTSLTVAEEVTLTLHPDQVLNRVDEKVYGHFLEHIYHSCNGGLWGELVWNRSFEQNDVGQWSIRDGRVLQESLGTNQRLTFGDAAWSDYEFNLEARKMGGSEGFLILFRVKSEGDFYWCNLGGWGNTRHSLERGRAGEGRWGAVGPQVQGEIDTDRWYPIRVRCEGPRLQVWLDDRRLIDFTDPRGHLQGAVGVGTWGTRAEFRNLRVQSLDGKVLFEGLPKSLVRPSTARHWSAFGPGQAFLESVHALNSRYCQRIVGGAGETGLEQGDFSLREGETYEGSVWVRGRAADGLRVRLRDGSSTLAEATLPSPHERWREYAFQLAIGKEVAGATLQVAVRGKGEVWIDQVSLLPRSWKKQGGFRPDLLEAIADLGPPIIRWPGGCFASAYRWKDGIGPQHERGVYPREIWDDLDVNSFGTDEFIAMCRKVGAEPLIVVNIGTPSWNGEVERGDFLQEVRDWIDYCNGSADSMWGKVRAANGHPEPYGVRYWEIDNETWHLGAERYAEAVRIFAPAMRRADPSMKLAACGSGGYGRGGLDWNRVIIEQCADLIDYLSIHHYEGPDNFQRGPVAYERFFHETAELIKKSKNPDLKLYVSEWNAQSTDWRTGLYCGGLLNAFERCGDFLEIGGPALFLRHVSATAWDNAFINLDQRSWFPAPNYVVMKLWREHHEPRRVALEGDAGSLNVVAAVSAEGSRGVLKAVNPTDEAVLVRLVLPAAWKAGDASLQVVAPGELRARNTIERPHAVKPEAGKVQVEGRSLRFELPALSAGVLTIPRTRG